HCVKCTICETFCPYSRVTPLFPGPKYVGPQAERYRTGDASPDASVDYCSGCGICTQVCPQGVKIAEINAQARARLWEDRGVPPQRCCGLPHQANGNFNAARAYVRRLVANLAPYAREGLPIVANSTSCGLMLKREAREILDLEVEDVVAVSDATYDLCEFLL